MHSTEMDKRGTQPPCSKKAPLGKAYIKNPDQLGPWAKWPSSTGSFCFSPHSCPVSVGGVIPDATSLPQLIFPFSQWARSHWVAAMTSVTANYPKQGLPCPLRDSPSNHAWLACFAPINLAFHRVIARTIFPTYWSNAIFPWSKMIQFPKHLALLAFLPTPCPFES